VNWREVIEREGRILVDTARRAPGAAVPACPGFDTGRLVRHADFVLRRIRVAVEGTSSSAFRRDDALPPPVPVEEALAAFPVDLDALLAAIAGADPDAPTWTLTDPAGRVGFWPRRAAHELTVHRVDAQQAAGEAVTPVDPGLALDGVAELLELAAAQWPGEDVAPVTVHLHATDAEGEWLVHLGPGGLTVESGHAKGDAAVRGPIGDLHLWLWGRGPLDGSTCFGDGAAVDLLRRAAHV
jgi:uncharacterized protein (TIGR03083 family)